MDPFLDCVLILIAEEQSSSTEGEQRVSGGFRAPPPILSYRSAPDQERQAKPSGYPNRQWERKELFTIKKKAALLGGLEENN